MNAKIFKYLYFLFILQTIFLQLGFAVKSNSYVETISDPKEWKKILRTRTNILVLYSKEKPPNDVTSIFSDVSRELRGTATLIQIDCSGDGKKLCKKNKIDNISLYQLKHYKDGEFHKDYDRRMTAQSMITFLRDPSGDLPWDEDPMGSDVQHMQDLQSLGRVISRESPLMVMFYAPWCGFCKRLKPDYSAASTELKESHVLAAIDLSKPENSAAREVYNITGFPTLIYFKNGKPLYTYEGDNNKAGIVSFMRNPGPAKGKTKEDDWSAEKSDVVHLTDKDFHQFIEQHSSVLVMFYAPWCGHCKKMKPEYTLAASILKAESSEGILAAVDATKERSVTKEFGVKGYPSIKFFAEGKFAFDVGSVREKSKIVEFMRDPKEPPPPPPTERPWAETESAVIHLSEETFKSFLKKKKHALVMFYAPWCGHCKKAKPEFTRAAESFSEEPRVEFAAVDCTEHASLCSQNEVRGYPTFVYFSYFKNSKPYDGDRSEKEFVKFMTDPDNYQRSSSSGGGGGDPKDQWRPLEGSEFLHHLTQANFDAFIKTKPALVLFYAPWCGHCKSMKSDYALAAKQLHAEGIEGQLAYVDATIERSLASKYEVKGFPTLKYFLNGVEDGEYSGDRSSSSFVSFVKNRVKSRSAKNEL